jgi:hypothetical protein
MYPPPHGNSSDQSTDIECVREAHSSQDLSTDKKSVAPLRFEIADSVLELDCSTET